ncbi:hypothetical protein BpHYR1_025246 [Brachionus plicatilis]|uniref:Uncharacterized protein n=1 Tax=Brachionus plicatilis TaxID=10195 RepID=A0A3M7PNK5_BRAPC|nr:hypothetical protein BpHYR1_025246 [Brachionus plicatilis]
MISSHNKRTSFRIIEPKKFHHAQQIPVSLSNQQIPILTLREDNRINNGIQSSYHDNMTNDAYSDEQQLNLKEFTRQFPQRTRNLSDTDSSYIPVRAFCVLSGLKNIFKTRLLTIFLFGFLIKDSVENGFLNQNHLSHKDFFICSIDLKIHDSVIGQEYIEQYISRRKIITMEMKAYEFDLFI